MRRWCWLWLLVLPATADLPVFLADNHAESFAWASRTLDLDREHVLVLSDAHSDASAVERSDELREQLRRVVSEDERAERVEAWRVSGRVQAYNWIEPLMPRPFGRVVWVSPGGNLEAQREMAGRQCDGRLEVEPRSAGAMASRWEVMDLAGMEAWKPGASRVLWSLDLDYFAGMEAAEAAASFERMWVAAMDWPGLMGVSVSVSRPWLKSDEEADRLVAMLLSAVARTRGASLEIDASKDDRPDDSVRAAEGSLSRWDFAEVSEVVNGWVTALGGRCRVVDRRRCHERDEPSVRLSVDGMEKDLDGVWRVDSETPIVIRLRSKGGSGRVRWYALEPTRRAYDLLPETGLGKGFSSEPGRRVYERQSQIEETWDFALDGGRWLDRKGRVRIGAEYESEGAWIPAGVLELRFGEGEGFRRALSESFGMPYVFGISGIEEDGLTGPETGWGADCSNVLIHAWRRNGVPMSWGDPAKLRSQLYEKPEGFSPDEFERGVMIDFDRHVAALWEDRGVKGQVDAPDLLFHHLGGVPEITTVAELQRGRPVLRVWTLPVKQTIKVRVAGDVTPLGDYQSIEGFEKGESCVFLVNLEGIPTGFDGVAGVRYDFRFPAERLERLREAEVDAVSLANNHAGDAGPDGLIDGIQNLRQAGIAVFGAGRDEAEACRPWVDGELACFGVTTVPSLIAGEEAGVAKLPEHALRIEGEMFAAQRKGKSIVVFVHWGDEYRDEVNEEQRHWARWLVARGASLVVGAGPHVVQREESFGGAVVAHSLGNAIFPESLKGRDEGRVGEWELIVGE